MGKGNEFQGFLAKKNKEGMDPEQAVLIVYAKYLKIKTTCIKGKTFQVPKIVLICRFYFIYLA